jgi:hypothetical protein
MNYYQYYKIPTGLYSIPLTYHISEISAQADKDFSHFKSLFLEREKSKSNNTWIIKPGENSNRGRGITVSGNIQEISSNIKDNRHSHIIQEYISNLLLYQRRKFDIRAYCLVTQVCGVMRAYWY